MRVGDIVITPVLDGSFDLPASVMYTKPGGEWGPHQRFLNEDGTLTLDVGGFLVRTGDRLALVDAGFGPWAHGRLLRSLATAGVRPDEITDLLFTHLHFDHIGWVSDEGRAVFPNAVVRFDERDGRHFLEDSRDEAADRAGAPQASEKLAPVTDRIELWDGAAGGRVVPGIDVAAAPGHTPGSTVLIVSSGSSRAVLLGDAVHCPVELLDPEWDVIGDVDPQVAQQTREALVREYEGTDVPMAAAHFPGMTFGRLLPGEGQRQWVIA